MRSLQGALAVITGATSGVGKAISLMLAGHGTVIYAVGRRADALDELVRDVALAGARAVCIRADLTNDEDIQNLAARLRTEADGLDLLIHSAGIFGRSPMQTALISDLDLLYRTNVRAPYLLTNLLLPMLKSRQGQVVFINSSAGLAASAKIGQYAATKHALRAVADSLRSEVSDCGIRVLSVYLGRTATPMQRLIHDLEGRAYYPERLIQAEDVAAIVIHAVCAPSTVEVTDISLRPLLKLL